MNATIPYVQNVMGTAVTFHSRSGLPPEPVEDAMAHLEWVDDTFSTFKESSEISRINAGDLLIEDAHDLVHHVLLRCAQLEDATHGAFDYGRSSSLDPAGFVKGWAIDGAAGILRAAGIDEFLVWAGGDIVAENQIDAEPWRIGIRDPWDPSRAVDHVEVSTGAIATSGTYERGDHIRGVESTLASVTVAGPYLGVADALATAVFTTGLHGAQWLGAFPEYSVIAVTNERTIARTKDRAV